MESNTTAPSPQSSSLLFVSAGEVWSQLFSTGPLVPPQQLASANRTATNRKSQEAKRSKRLSFTLSSCSRKPVAVVERASVGERVEDQPAPLFTYEVARVSGSSSSKRSLDAHLERRQASPRVGTNHQQNHPTFPSIQPFPSSPPIPHNNDNLPYPSPLTAPTTSSSLGDPRDETWVSTDQFVDRREVEKLIGLEGVNGFRMAESERTRVSKACAACRSRKSKCDGQATCTRCISRGIACIYHPDAGPRVNKRKACGDGPSKRFRGSNSSSSVESYPPSPLLQPCPSSNTAFIPGGGGLGARGEQENGANGDVDGLGGERTSEDGSQTVVDVSRGPGGMGHTKQKRVSAPRPRRATTDPPSSQRPRAGLPRVRALFHQQLPSAIDPVADFGPDPFMNLSYPSMFPNPHHLFQQSYWNAYATASSYRPPLEPLQEYMTGANMNGSSPFTTLSPPLPHPAFGLQNNLYAFPDSLSAVDFNASPPFDTASSSLSPSFPHPPFSVDSPGLLLAPDFGHSNCAFFDGSSSSSNATLSPFTPVQTSPSYTQSFPEGYDFHHSAYQHDHLALQMPNQSQQQTMTSFPSVQFPIGDTELGLYPHAPGGAAWEGAGCAVGEWSEEGWEQHC